MSKHPNGAIAQIVKRKGIFTVKIINTDSTIIWARRQPGRGYRITYDKPERVPRIMKNVIVPNLFKQIDREKWSGTMT